MTKFGVGYSEFANSFKAGQASANDALTSSGIEADSIKLCFLFCTSRHEASEFYAGVKSVIGDKQFIGGYANGAVCNGHFGYDGHQCVVGILQTEDVNIHLFKEEGIAFNEYETGKALFRQIKNTDFESDPILILLFDAVNRQKGYFQMNFGTPLLSGALEEIKQWPAIVGARLMGDMKFKPTFQWIKDEMVQNSALAVALTGNLHMDVLRLDGCAPASSYHTVTKSDGATILEIDQKPALNLVMDMLGPEVKDNYRKIKFFVTLGKNLGDKWDRKKAKYVNRMCVGVNPESRGIIMAENDLQEGTEIQFMRRGFDTDSLQDNVHSFIENVENAKKKPVFAMYFNCAGRATAYSQNDTEDVVLIQKAVKDRFPLMGIYEAGELAKINGKLEVFDWTGIFCLFSENN